MLRTPGGKNLEQPTAGLREHPSRKKAAHYLNHSAKSMHLKCLILSASLLCCSIYADAQTCAKSRKESPLGARLAKAAINEYAEFNGHRINADGYLWKSGSVESEAELLLDPDSGLPDANRPGRFAWRRVWEYWLTLDRHVKGEALSRKVISVPGLLENPAAAGKPIEFRLSQLFQAITAEGSVGEALRDAAVRAALNDAAWSAAFISYLMDQVGLTDQQFHYSSAHWQYIKRAFEQPEGYAFKACDPRRTTPGIGDLLCYSRGASNLKSFKAWRQAVKDPGFSAASHCEVVINVDTSAKKIETVGGNVLQSVTRRRLKLNEENVLSDAHDPDRSRTRKNLDCARDKTCHQANLNLQYWSVLLQLQ